MVTAFSQRDIVSRAVEAGVFGYLVKPFREDDLLPAIETARARHAEAERCAPSPRPARRPGGAPGIERAKGL